ncbi:hypothetical protein GO621_13990 [Mucilaginibacter sp. HMF7410]|uniref:Protein BatD n=1 Tax=Mucilaginibacter arboris TaxID=2682090 RepID=A0A7K1T015_9SPHI|nr:hypothetical protein [Mucilaginibacter arboris]
MNRFLSFILIFLLTGVYFNASAQSVQVEARLDRVSIPIGDQTLLHISVRMPLKTDITFPELKDSIGKVQIVKSLKADTAVDKKDPNQETITHSYAITSFDAGVYVLPQFTFHTKTGDFKTGTVTLQVKAVPVDTTKTFYDIKQPLAVSYTFWDWLKDHWIAVMITLAAVLLTAGLVYYYKKRPVKEASIVNTVPILSADTIAINKLNELRAKKLWQQNEVKLYYSELTDVLREYLEKRYQVKAHEQTTDEIFDGLKNKEIPQDNRNTLKQLLTLADLVKFAKQKPTAFENEQSMDNAINFIVQTKHQPKPIDKEDLPK